MRLSFLFITFFILLATSTAVAAKINTDSIITKNIAGINLSKEVNLTNDSGNVLSKALYYWDNVLSEWAGISRYDYDYNDANLQILYISFKWEMSVSAWENDVKYEYTYNADGKRLYYAMFKWESKSWVGKTKHNYDYDVLGNQTLDIVCDWNFEDSIWVNYSKIEAEFDDLSTQLSVSSYSWNLSTNEWSAIEKYKTESIYNTAGLPTTTTKLRWNKAVDVWGNVSRNASTYDKSGNLLTAVIMYWNNTDNSWENSIKSKFAYDKYDNETSSARYEWNSSKKSWDIIYEYQHTYDTEGNVTMFAHYETNSGVRLGVEKREMTYDSKGVCLEVVSYKWNISTHIWLFAYRYNASSAGTDELYQYTSQWDDIDQVWKNISIGYYYSDITDVEERGSVQTEIVLYPNPTTDEFQVINIYDKSQLSIYSIEGKLLVSKVVAANEKISLGNYQSGIYFVKIESEGDVKTIEVVKR